MKAVKFTEEVYELLKQEIEKYNIPVNEITINSCIYNYLAKIKK